MTDDHKPAILQEQIASLVEQRKQAINEYVVEKAKLADVRARTITLELCIERLTKQQSGLVREINRLLAPSTLTQAEECERKKRMLQSTLNEIREILGETE